MSSPFAAILRSAVERTPGALAGAFAAHDGEMVDAFCDQRRDDWAELTAHYGVLLAHVQSALHTFHYGDAELLLLQHRQIDILVRAVAEGYYALLAVGHRATLGTAIASLERAVAELRREMG